LATPLSKVNQFKQHPQSPISKKQVGLFLTILFPSCW